MDEETFFLNGETLPPPKFIPSEKGNVIIFGSYNARGYYHSERVFKDFGPPRSTSSPYTTIHLKNVDVNAKIFTSELRKLNVTSLHTIILENVRLVGAGCRQFLGVEVPKLRKFVIQCSHPYHADKLPPLALSLPSSSSTSTRAENISANDVISMLFFEKHRFKNLGWGETPSLSIDKDVKIMFGNVLHFEMRKDEGLLYLKSHPADELLRLYNKSPSLKKLILHQVNANPVIINGLLPKENQITFLELVSTSWEQIEYHLSTQFPHLRELVYQSVYSNMGPDAPSITVMNICSLPKSLKRLTLGIVQLWIQQSSSTVKQELDSLTIRDCKLMSTFEKNILERFSVKKLLFMGEHKYLPSTFLESLIKDERISSLYVETGCIKWVPEGEGELSVSGVMRLIKDHCAKMDKMNERTIMYSGIGSPFPVFLEREKFDNPFQYLLSSNPGNDKWLLRPSFFDEDKHMGRTYLGFPVQDQRGWREPITRTKEEKDGEVSLTYVNTEETPFSLRLIDIWKSDINLKNISRMQLKGLTLFEEDLKELFQEIRNVKTLVISNVHVSRKSPQEEITIPPEQGFSPRKYIPLDLSLLFDEDKALSNLCLLETWVTFLDKRKKAPLILDGLGIFGYIDGDFWTEKIANYFQCKYLLIGAERVAGNPLAPTKYRTQWWPSVSPSLLSSSLETGAKLIQVFNYDKLCNNTDLSKMGAIGWETDFLINTKSEKPKFLRLDWMKANALVNHLIAGNFLEAKKEAELLFEASTSSKDKVLIRPPFPLQPGFIPQSIDYLLEGPEMSRKSISTNKGNKALEFFGFGIFSNLVELRTIKMFNVLLKWDNFLKQVARIDIDLTKLTKIEMLVTDFQKEAPKTLSPNNEKEEKTVSPIVVDLPSLRNFTFKIRTWNIGDLINIERAYQTWDQVEKLIFFSKNGKRITPQTLMGEFDHFEFSYYDQKIIYFDKEEKALISRIENLNELLHTFCYEKNEETWPLSTLGLKADTPWLLHALPSSLTKLYLDVLFLPFESVENLISNQNQLPNLTHLYFMGAPGMRAVINKLPPNLKHLEFSSPLSSIEELLQIDFTENKEGPINLDSIAFFKCSFSRKEIRYNLQKYLKAKRIVLDCDDFDSISRGYKAVHSLIHNVSEVEEIFWINRNFKGIGETEDERWDSCLRELDQDQPSMEAFKEIDALIQDAGVVEIEDKNGVKTYRDWVRFNKENGKWTAKRIKDVEETMGDEFYTSEWSFDPKGKRMLKDIVLIA